MNVLRILFLKNSSLLPTNVKKHNFFDNGRNHLKILRIPGFYLDHENDFQKAKLSVAVIIVVKINSSASGN